MKTITTAEIKNLDSTKHSVEHFRYMGWTMKTHRHEIMTGMMSHLVNWHGFVPENDMDSIEVALQELAPELF